MVSDAPEQVTTPQADQVGAQGLEQVLPAASAAPEAVPAPASGDAAPVAQTFDLSTDAGIKAAIEANPQLRGFLDKTKADTENTVRQRLENQMRRDQGANARAQQWQQSLAQKYGIELDPEDAQAAPLFVKANEEWQRTEILRSLAQQAIDLSPADEQAALQSLLDSADSADAVTRITAASLEALQGRVKRQTLEELEVEQLEAHPKFKEYIAAYKQREAEAEMNAREIERQQRDAPPPTPSGQGAQAMTRSQLDAMTPAARLSYLAGLSDEERSTMWDLAMSSE